MKKKIVIPIVVLTAIAIAIFFIVRQKRKKADETIFPLVLGSRGKEVESLQRALNNAAPDGGLVVDGVLGPVTLESMMHFLGITKVVSRKHLDAIISVTKTKHELTAADFKKIQNAEKA